MANLTPELLQIMECPNIWLHIILSVCGFFKFIYFGCAGFSLLLRPSLVATCCAGFSLRWLLLFPSMSSRVLRLQ